jgi:hypothetical protein
MRWKWKLGLILVAALESPLLAWGGLVLHLPAQALGYLATILTAILLGMLALRPMLFAYAGLWLFGIAGSSAYLLRYLPPSFAIGLGTILSTIGCSVGLPWYRRVLGLILRRHV